MALRQRDLVKKYTFVTFVADVLLIIASIFGIILAYIIGDVLWSRL